MKYGGKTSRAWLLGSAATVAIVWSGAAAAEEASFNIAPQPLASALNEFSIQSRQSVLFTTDLADAKASQGVSGHVDVAEALGALLAGTGLTYRRNGDTFLVTRADQDPQGAGAAGGGAEVEALIVTAQKREEDIQDVPIAISAFTQEALERSQIVGGPDLITQVPNMTFTKTNFTGYSIQIRGIGTQAVSATVDPAVAVAFNNTPFIRNRFFEQEFYDLARVEVLRGPQGTLYGRNATAGVVNIISARPSFVYEAKASADLGNYSSRRFEAMANLPLVEDKVALRLAGAWTMREGYAFNQTTGSHIDGRDLWSGRLSLRVEPVDGIRANLIYEHFEEDDDRLRSGKQLCKKDDRSEIAGLPISGGGGTAPGHAGSLEATFTQGCVAASMYSADSFQTPNGFALPYYAPLTQIWFPARAGFDPYLSTTQSTDLRVIESTLEPQYRAQSDLAQLQIEIDIGDRLTLTTETAYSADTLFSTQDYNRFNTAPGAFLDDLSYFPDGQGRPGVLNNGVFCDPQLGCADRVVAADLSTADSRQFSQELRLSSDFDGPFNFSLGANFLRYDTDDKYYVFFNTLGLFSAMLTADTGTFARYNQMPPYVPGVSDNSECLPHGIAPENPEAIYSVNSCIYIDPNPIDSLNDQGHNYFLSNNPYKLISYAVFGEAYYQVTPTLKLTGGLRWTVDKKQAPKIPSWLLASDSAGYPVAGVVDQEWREPTGRVTLDWKPDLSFTDETLLYASLAHGYKAGGANPPPPVPSMRGTSFTINNDRVLAKSLSHPPTFDPEFINAFEVGAKNTLFDGVLTLNTTAFYYDYEGYQISQIVNRSAINLNFDAEVWGLEIEADWRPTENLRLGFKGGYERTRVADGSEAIDLMDRTAGNPDWVVARPFPTFPSNCILPVWLVTFGGELSGVSGDGGYEGPCVTAYFAGLDPVTRQAYTPFPYANGGSVKYRDYPGFDPTTAPNNGEGIAKDLGGNELPNAPRFTTTFTADYVIPLRDDWSLRLHTDVYRQSEAWARIFNSDPYDHIRPYTTVNLAAQLTSEESGWRLMAYVKNVFDKTSITGSFLNSDDSGLTTNVFLTEPRLYGLRVTKEWLGGPLFSGSGDRVPGAPYTFTFEAGGSVQRHDAPNPVFSPAFLDDFSPTLDPRGLQGQDLDHGDGRELKLTYQPAQADWFLSAGLRFGRTNGSGRFNAQELGDRECGQFKYGACSGNAYREEDNFSNATMGRREEHAIADLVVGKDIGLGLFGQSSVGLGLRYAHFKSEVGLTMDGVPDWVLDERGAIKYDALHTHHRAALTSKRSFEGAGPALSWDASSPIWGSEETGHVNLDWSVNGAVLYGRQTTEVEGFESSADYSVSLAFDFRPWSPASPATVTPLNTLRQERVFVPAAGLAVGMSYAIQKVKLSAGYRWERYFDAIDGGYDETQQFDRTIDGPYFKLAVGFGG